MARDITCDVCGKPANKIVAKLYYSPLSKGSGFHHSKYTHHLDVGACCGDKRESAPPKILVLFRWRKRQTAKEYHESRSNDSPSA